MRHQNVYIHIILYSPWYVQTHLLSLLLTAFKGLKIINQLNTPQILHIGTHRFDQTMHILIRLILNEQSHQGLHSLPFHLHFFKHITALENNTVKFLVVMVLIVLGPNVCNFYSSLFKPCICEFEKLKLREYIPIYSKLNAYSDYISI